MSTLDTPDDVVVGVRDEAVRAAAASISAARSTRTTCSQRTAGLSLIEAYAVQRARSSGQVLRGRKVGMVSPAKRAQFGMSEPIHGPVYDEMLLSAPLRLDGFIQPRLEPELAAVLTADVPPGANPGVVAAAVPGLFLAVDVLDTVWAEYRCTPAEAVADNLNGGGFLLGDQCLPLSTDGMLHMLLDGREIGAGPVSDLGDPVARIAWVADSVGGLRSGETVFLGSPTANVPALRGTLEVRGPENSVLIARLV